MYDDEAIAEPHPKVLNLTSEMMPSSLTLICSFMTAQAGRRRICHCRSASGRQQQRAGQRGSPSPHAGAPTSPEPTVMSFLSSEPT